MNKNTRQILAIGLIVAIIALLLIFKKEERVGPEPSVDPIAGCYIQALGKDVYTLNVKSETAGMVSGDLAFKNFQKDSSSGTFYGKYEDGVIFADYEFASEGMNSVMEVAFKRVGKDFVRGFGETSVEGIRSSFVDKSAITYDAKDTFKYSADCVAPTVAKEVAYKNIAYKLSFKRLETYYIKEKTDAGTPESPQLAVVLVEDTEENRAVIDGTSTEVREGPTSINVDVYQNKEKLGAKDWVGKDTNWTVANSVVTKTTVAGLEALSFTWSGLYEGKTVIVTRGDKAYVFSVTWLTDLDPIKKDFEKLLGTVQFI